MKLGAVFPQTEIGADPGAIREYVQAVEGLGFDYLLTYEHVIGADPAQHPEQTHWAYTHTDMFHEPMVLFGFLASITQRLEFATGILILPQRDAVLTAKQVAEIDLLSGGRLRLGIGVGWNRVEMAALGYDFRMRGRRIEEQIAVMNALWTTPLVDFDGEFHKFHAVGLNPLPVQRPIPLWFGGSADVVLRRMARYGAGWMPTGLSPEQGEPLIERLNGYLLEVGRDPGTFGLDVRLSVGRQPRETWDVYIEGWRALGMTHLCANTMGAGFASVDEHIAALRTFKDAVG